MSPPADSSTPPSMVETDTLSGPQPRPPFWRDRRMQRLRWPIMGAVVVLALLIGLLAYLTGGRYENTDDASVQGATISIAPSISGRVIMVKVKDNQQVRAGEILFQIDGRPFQTAYAQASAALANARLQVEQLKATYQQCQADEKAA
ncbi:MAG: biotin/lipoyl-binding protein, partial [Caulobacteraceae bacterium]|nr:biotin/lipoyl-binding protein [Caulobacteraceae bacterium]